MSILVDRTLMVLAMVAVASSLIAQERITVRGGTLVDVKTGRLSPNTTVVIEGDRIVSVGPETTANAADGTILDANGKYILPGLIDLHVHYRDWAAELYLNHGVTTVVDLGSPHEWIKAQKDGIQRGTIPGPRLMIGTANLDGPPADGSYYMRGFVHVLKDSEDAIKALRQYVSANVDAVKVYDGLSMEVLRALGREANRQKIPMIGHFPDVRIAAEVGGQGIEHLGAVAKAILDPKAKADAATKIRKGFSLPPESYVDQSKIRDIAQFMVKNGLYLNPTLNMSWRGDPALRELGQHYQDFDLTFNNWNLRYIPLTWRLANLKEYQEMDQWHWADLTPVEQELFHQGYLNSQKIVKAFVDAGGKLYAGTDSASMTTPGLVLHQELELFVAAGLSPLQALQAATINSAELMRKQDQLGTVEPGKAGDVVILEANPLENIHNTRKIWKVISRGKLVQGYNSSFRNPIPKNDWEGSSHFFPSPRIRWASPEALIAGRATKIIVHGSGFIPYSFVRWNGKKLNTEYKDEFQLVAELPMDLASVDTFAVTVENPDFGWGSNLANGASDISHLGVRGPISNEFLVLVKPEGGSPIFSHPREQQIK